MVDKFFLQGLNIRLGTKGLSFGEILEQLAARSMTLGELGRIPEDPSWRYGEDNGHRYMCSALIAQILKESGVITKDILPHEFTPNDVYNLNIYKPANQLPAECRLNDPYLPYCQLTGHRALLPFKYYNSITPYDHMNESCPNLAPFIRPPGC